MTLTIDMIPNSSFFKNVRSHVSKKQWDIIRKKVYKNNDHKCEICNGQGKKHPVECHEIWDYDYSTETQTLIGLIALCPSCHKTKHFGHTQLLGLEHLAIAQLKKVNGWSYEEIQKHIQNSWTEWHYKNKIKWKLNLDYLEIINE